MAAMPNSWPICMKFSMRVVFHEKTTHAKNRPDRTTICKIICKLKKFFFFFTFPLFVFLFSILKSLFFLSIGVFNFQWPRTANFANFFCKKKVDHISKKLNKKSIFLLTTKQDENMRDVVMAKSRGHHLQNFSGKNFVLFLSVKWGEHVKNSENLDFAKSDERSEL